MTTEQTAATLLSMPDAARRLGCSRSYIYRLIASGQLRSVDIRVAGNTRPKTRVYEHEVAAFIERQTT